jgi:hypothetical protein
MKCFLKTAASLTLALFSMTASAQVDLINPAYIYAEQARANVNWLYIGMVPRTQDSSRVKVIISKAGLTMRITQNLSIDEIADYPNYLIRRYRQVAQTIATEGLTFSQEYRFRDYEAQILIIEHELQSVAADLQSRYTYGFNLLKRHYPQNVFEIVQNGSVAYVQTHFVYPITIHKSVTWPRPGSYRPYIVEERRSYYSKAKGLHVFGGFPAFWLDPAGAGTGVHGPIRFSDAGDGRRDGGEGRMRQFWTENNFLNEVVDPVTSLKPTYRWDLVRTNQSHGCFRAEPLEPRHLLPSNPHSILDDNKVKRNLGTGPGRNTTEIDYDSVEFIVQAEYDTLTVEGYFQNAIVNVDYYVLDPYQKADKDGWLRQYMLTGAERKGKDWRTTLQTKMQSEIVTFPYLDPAALEFYTPSRGASSRVMGILNRAH